MNHTIIAIVTLIYDKFWPKSRIKVRHNKSATSWITNKNCTEIVRKLSKNCNSENEMNYRNYRRLLESVKRKSIFSLQSINTIPRRWSNT